MWHTQSNFLSFISSHWHKMVVKGPMLKGLLVRSQVPYLSLPEGGAGQHRFVPEWQSIDSLKARRSTSALYIVLGSLSLLKDGTSMSSGEGSSIPERPSPCSEAQAKEKHEVLSSLECEGPLPVVVSLQGTGEPLSSCLAT